MSTRRPTPDSFILSRGHFQWQPNDTFGDSRTFGHQSSPSRHVILDKVTLDGGSFNLNPVTGQLVVVARDTLKIVSSTDPKPGKHDTDQGPFYSSHHRPTSNVGPGGTSLDASQNFWRRELRTTHVPTTVTWGPEQFREKAFVGCANGDILVWDFGTGAARLDVKVKESPRAIHDIVSAPISPYSFASGSADGCIRLWDWREGKGPVYTVAHQLASVRSLAIGPFVDTQLNIVAGLDSGMLFRYDLRYRIEYLDRLVAHDGNIQGIHWLPPNGDRAMKGHIVTGSLDGTVKVWHVTSGRIAANPVHTLHTPYPVGRIAIRPEHDTEVVVLPFHGGAAATTAPIYEVDDTTPEFDRFAPQIWDVRKGWIAKWGMSGILGPATDMVVKDSHSVQILYKSGTIAQHDLHRLSKPPDSINKQCLAWTPHSTLVFATGPQRSFDPPYDDLYPHVSNLIKDFYLVDKHPGDRLTLSANQIIASQDISDDFDRVAFTKLARGYLLNADGDRIKICEVNQEVAASAGQHQIAETWSVVASLLAPFAPRVPESSSTTHETSARSTTPMAPRTTLSPGASPKPTSKALSSSGLPDGVNLPRKGSGGPAMLLQSLDITKRRCSSPSLLASSRPSTSSRSSPASRIIALPVFSSSSSSSLSPHPQTPTASTLKRPEIERRTSSSTLSNPNESPISAGVEAKASSGNWAGGGDGALEDSDSEEDDEALGMADPNEFERAFAGKTPTARGTQSSWSKERRAMSLSAGAMLLGGGIGTLTLGPKVTAATSSAGTCGNGAESSPESLRAKKLLPATRALDRSSPRASPRVLSPRVLSSDLPDVDEESSVDRGGAEQSSSSEAESRSSSESNGPTLQIRTNGGSSSRRKESQDSSVDLEREDQESMPPSPILARAPGPPAASRRVGVPTKDSKLQKRESMSSVRTAMPTSGGAGGTLRARKGMKMLEALRGRSDLVDEGREDDKDHSSSLKVPHLRDIFDNTTASNPNNSLTKRSTRSRSTGGGLIGEKAISIVVDEKPRDERSKWMVSEQQEEIAAMERMVRWKLWAHVKESLEYYVDIGDVQTCALLAMVVPDELGISKARIEQFVESYIDLLSRLELHVVAAYVRKHAPVQWIRRETAINCSISTKCVRCRKTITNHGSSSSESMRLPGALAYCQNCRAPAILCSICHLPVRKLLMFCNGCGHGGHQICYRRFYSKHPMIEVAVEKSASRPQRKRPPPISPTRELNRGRRRDTRGAAAVTGEGEEQGPRREIEQDLSVPEHYLVVQQQEKEARERIKTKVLGHLCAEGCGHICWVANEFSDSDT